MRTCTKRLVAKLELDAYLAELGKTNNVVFDGHRWTIRTQQSKTLMWNRPVAAMVLDADGKPTDQFIIIEDA